MIYFMQLVLLYLRDFLYLETICLLFTFYSLLNCVYSRPKYLSSIVIV